MNSFKFQFFVIFLTLSNNYRTILFDVETSLNITEDAKFITYLSSLPEICIISFVFHLQIVTFVECHKVCNQVEGV